MYSTHLRRPPSHFDQFVAWIASPNLVRAVALSLLIGAAMTAAFRLDQLPPRAIAADTPPVVTRYVDAVSPDAAWSADESATGTPPDRAH